MPPSNRIHRVDVKKESKQGDELELVDIPAHICATTSWVISRGPLHRVDYIVHFVLIIQTKAHVKR